MKLINNISYVNIFLGKQDLEEYTKTNVFRLPTNIFIDNYMKSFCNDPFDDEFTESLIKSDIK